MITLDNYESYLFLYQEGELDSATRTEVERFLLQHPDIREEMEQYYDPSLIVTCIKPTQKPHRTIALWRWVAAACVLLALGYGVYLMLPLGGTDQPMSAAVRPTETMPATIPTDSLPKAATKPPIPDAHLFAKNTPHQETVFPSTPSDHSDYSDYSDHSEISDPSEITTIPNPAIIYSDQLADIVIQVDDLATEVPNSNPYPTPNLATLLINKIQNRRQQYIDFLKDEFALIQNENQSI